MDVSDGLAGDLAKMCRASRLDAAIDVARVPLSRAARTALAAEPALIETILTGGDDYEVLASVPARKRRGAAQGRARGGRRHHRDRPHVGRDRGGRASSTRRAGRSNSPGRRISHF